MMSDPSNPSGHVDEDQLPDKPAPEPVDEVTDAEISGDDLINEGEADIEFADEAEANEDDTIDTGESEDNPADDDVRAEAGGED